jgi:FKBP-type peptidyl-prolyl cis-trans isomerase (trigger factor)
MAYSSLRSIDRTLAIPQLDAALFAMQAHQSVDGLCTLTITIHRDLVEPIYQAALAYHRAHAYTHGFAQGAVPIEYVERNYKANLQDHVRDFLLSTFIMSAVTKELMRRGIVACSEPELREYTLAPTKDAQFVFTVQAVGAEYNRSWPRTSFRAPGRKNYKDIDRQVDTVIREEEAAAMLARKRTSIAVGDYILITLKPMSTHNNAELLKDQEYVLWLRVSGEEPDKELHGHFIGKQVGEPFFVESPILHHYIGCYTDMRYKLQIVVREILQGDACFLDQFCHHFGIKTRPEMHEKLIQVFSFRHDISLRRELVDLALRAVSQHHRIVLPEKAIIAQEKVLLAHVQKNPDYPVYKAQKDFKAKLRMLAEKQLRERVAIDLTAHYERITVTHADIVAYLNLHKRPRMKEFVHFSIPSTRHDEQEVPILATLVERECRREKTLNYIIKTLHSKHL